MSTHNTTGRRQGLLADQILDRITGDPIFHQQLDDTALTLQSAAIADIARSSRRDQVSTSASTQPPHSAPTARPTPRTRDERMEPGSLFTIIAEACQNANAANAANAANTTDVEGFDGVGEWQVEPARHAGDIWIHVTHRRAVTPEQGWKLHVAANGATARPVLRRALPILLAEEVSFKVAASLRDLGFLNEGDGGISQIGKFITVYPADDTQAVRLAVTLDGATRGLRGPSIPSDRPLTPTSLVHYRYGGFGDRHLQTPLGEILPALVTPGGELVPDRRLPRYQAPEWALDPFVAAGVAEELPEEPVAAAAPIGGRYLVVSTLHKTPRGAVQLAVDLIERRRCVLKSARRDTAVEADGRDTCDRLRFEAEVLRRLAPDPRFPAAFALVEEERDLYLVMEDIAGETLEQHVGGLIGQGRALPGPRIIAWGRELALALATVHDRGFIYRDLKSASVIVGTDGRLRVIDFDIAHEPAGAVPLYGRGTRAYWSPQQFAGEPAAVADDVYSLGALLYFMATGAEPSVAPREFALLDRPLALLNPGVPPGLEALIARCLHPDPTGRYSSMAEVEVALAAIGVDEPATPAPFGMESAPESEDDARQHSRELARRLGDTLRAAARRLPDGQGVAWVSTHEDGSGTLSRDLGSGSAGAVLALAELAAEFDDPALRAILADGASGLARIPAHEGRPLPGLYVGEAGAGAALLRAGQVLSDSALIAAAAQAGRRIATLPYASPDLYNGTAGRLRFHLLLWDETGEAEHLRAAAAAGERLLADAQEAGAGGLCWIIPPGYDGLSGTASLGYAHGAAGIADTLLDLYEVTCDRRFLAAAGGAGRWLAGLALPALDDGSGLNWPAEEGEGAFGAFWCHGSAGIGQFFLHAAALGVMPGATDFAARAARSVARGTRCASPTQCHGLAGNIEFLLDIYQATSDRAYLAEARSLARLMEAFASEQDGLLVFSSEAPTTFSPDYMIGYAGIAPCLLRLADPEELPRQLSRRGFRRHQADQALSLRPIPANGGRS